MARVSSKQASTDSFLSILPREAISSAGVYALVCFASGLAASALLGIVFPASADEDDIRSFISFGIGALICCLLLKKEPVPLNAEGKLSSARDDCASKTAYLQPITSVRKSSAGYATKQNFGSVMSPPGLSSTPADRASQSLGSARAPPLPKRLETPPGLEQVTPWRARPSVYGTTPTLNASPPPPVQYDPQSFRKEVMHILRELSLHKNVGRSVGQVRQQNVPVDRQAAEFTDILTYVVEEGRGNIRRTYMAFVGGLTGVFDKAECLAGIGGFFDGIYEGLCDEVEKLPRLVKIELLPTLNSMLSPEHVRAFVPEAIAASICT